MYGRHALLEISPAYFHYMTGTHNRATALAKIVGFYTGEQMSYKLGTSTKESQK